jgi:hypothetical protein
MKETGGERREVQFRARSPTHEWMEPVVYSPVHRGEKKSNRWTERSVQCVLFSKKISFKKFVKLKFEKSLSKTCQFFVADNGIFVVCNLATLTKHFCKSYLVIDTCNFLKYSLCSQLAISRIRQNYSVDEDVHSDRLAIDGYGAIYPIGRIPEAMGVPEGNNYFLVLKVNKRCTRPRLIHPIF